MESIWPGSSSFAAGETPYGFYDSDTEFSGSGNHNVDKFADWAAKRLGYPIVAVELQEEQFYACYEEAITEYSAQVNQFIIKDNMLDNFGWGNKSPGVSFMMMPMYADILKVQAIEFNDQIRKSAYSFELVNNKLRIFPDPTETYTLWFKYLVKKDRDSTLQGTTDGVITDFSNAPFNNMTFKNINEVGKQWIKKYGLALCKELLGTIRSKYASLPIPNAETTLDGDTLRTEAATEKEILVTQLREMLEQMSRKALLEADKDEAEFLQEKLAKVPYPIYIG